MNLTELEFRTRVNQWERSHRTNWRLLAEVRQLQWKLSYWNKCSKLCDPIGCSQLVGSRSMWRDSVFCSWPINAFGYLVSIVCFCGLIKNGGKRKHKECFLNFAWIISKWLSESSWPRFAISRMGLSSQQKGISLAIFQFGSVGAMWTKHCSNMSRVRVGSMTRCKSFKSTSRRSLGSTSELACTRTAAYLAVSDSVCRRLTTRP